MKRHDIPVLVPFGDNERYDVVVETPDRGFLRVQIKTGWMSDGKVEFKGKSQHTNASGNVYETYEGDVDYFLIHCHELEQLYVVPNDAFHTSMSLRVAEPEQVHETINWAADYEFGGEWPAA